MTLIARCRHAIDDIAARYGMPAPTSVTRLDGGSANLNFVARFEAGPALKITFSLYKDLAGTRRVAAILDALDSASVGRLMRPVDGEAVVALEQPVLVTTFTDGMPLDAIDASVAKGIGRLLGTLHIEPPPQAPARHDMDLDRLLDETDPETDLGAFVTHALASVPPLDALPHCLIHGDLFPDNIIRRPDGTLVAIDFEEACHGPRVFDLGMTLVGFDRVGGLTPETARALLVGYGSQRPLSDAELRALPAMVDYAGASTAGWRGLGAPEALDTGARDWREMKAVVARNRAWVADGTWRGIIG